MKGYFFLWEKLRYSLVLYLLTHLQDVRGIKLPRICLILVDFVHFVFLIIEKLYILTFLLYLDFLPTRFCDFDKSHEDRVQISEILTEIYVLL